MQVSLTRTWPPIWLAPARREPPHVRSRSARWKALLMASIVFERMRGQKKCGISFGGTQNKLKNQCNGLGMIIRNHRERFLDVNIHLRASRIALASVHGMAHSSRYSYPGSTQPCAAVRKNHADTGVAKVRNIRRTSEPRALCNGRGCCGMEL
jgi:hypothetical protein